MRREEVIHSTIDVYPKEGGNAQKQFSIIKMEKVFCFVLFSPLQGKFQKPLVTEEPRIPKPSIRCHDEVSQINRWARTQETTFHVIVSHFPTCEMKWLLSCIVEKVASGSNCLYLTREAECDGCLEGAGLATSEQPLLSLLCLAALFGTTYRITPVLPSAESQ